MLGKPPIDQSQAACGSTSSSLNPTGGRTGFRPPGSSRISASGTASASAGAAALGQSLTKRGRNKSFRILTAHDVEGFAEHDWRALARPGATAAIYMGVKAATFLRGRLLMHGAAADTPVGPKKPRNPVS